MKRRGFPHSTRLRLGGSLISGVAVGLAVVWAGLAPLAPLAGWDVTALVFVLWTFVTTWGLSPAQTASHAEREDPGRTTSDIFLLLASTVSLIAVGVLLAGAGTHTHQDFRVTFGIVSVVLSWTVVHTLFTVRYARLFYTGPDGGIDFNQNSEPRFSDFAYLAFTVGMTYQVSDTAIGDPRIRATALRHALLSFLFGSVIIATTINLVAGLVK